MKSYRENVVLPATLARACAKANVKLIHISTDYVSSECSKEFDIPVNIYGMHKLLGEKMIKEAYSDYKSSNYLILRTSWLFGPNSSHKTFVEKFMLNMYKTIAAATIEKKDRIDIPVAANTRGFPTSTWFLSSFIRNVIEVNMKGTTFAYQPIDTVGHDFPNITAVSRYDWAQVIAAVVCTYRDFNYNRKIDIVKTVYPVPKTIGIVHHPQDLRIDQVTLPDVVNFNPYICPKNYAACIKDSSSWKLHTACFMEYKNNFEQLEQWIFSKLSEEERKAIEQYPCLDQSHPIIMKDIIFDS